MSDSRPIGVFDSGVGGISVLRELVKAMPQENFIYYGDSANAPYGTKPFSQVEELTCAMAERLRGMDVKAIVIACNTATAAAVHILRERFHDMPIIGIEPALKPAVLHHPGGKVVVMATNVTLAEPKFMKLMDTYKNQADIFTIGCPDIVTHVEAGDTTSAELKEYIASRLMLAYPDLSAIDAVVLGCTHYPFVRGLLANLLRPDCEITDGGAGTAKETLHQLTLHDIVNTDGKPGIVDFNNTDVDKVMLAKRLFTM